MFRIFMLTNWLDQEQTLTFQRASTYENEQKHVFACFCPLQGRRVTTAKISLIFTQSGITSTNNFR